MSASASAISFHIPGRVGARPGHPFFQYLGVTIAGSAVKTVEVSDLPDGLSYDAQQRLISGTTPPRGSYAVTVRASEGSASATSTFEIVSSEELALTPPLGWSSWNYCGRNITDEKVRAAAKAMVDTGLREFGYSYINIDDGWQGKRCPDTLTLQPNEHFPDMADLCNYVHSLGLKIGIYSTPWRISYAGFVGGSADTPDGQLLTDIEQRGTGGKTDKYGAYEFHTQDAKQFADWGFDYLKYDWNPIDVHHTRIMAEALRDSGRDIVFSLSNSANFGEACEWARLSHIWRTTGDIADQFKTTPDAKHWEHSIMQCGFATADRWAPYVGPGHWGDPDMLVVGNFGLGGDLRESKLTISEQKVHLTQWALLASPLLLGCDISLLKPAVLELLTNPGLLRVNQDVLGAQARRIRTAGIATHESWAKGKFSGDWFTTEVWAKPLADGSYAVGMYNFDDDDEHEVGFALADIGLSGECTVTDLWEGREIGTVTGGFAAGVGVHECMMVQVTPK